MELYETIELRHTIRDFKDETISDEVIERIISAGMKAPTNDHMRDWHFIVIKDKDIALKLLNKIPKKASDYMVNMIIRNWKLKDPCQQDMYRDAIPKQHKMLLDASCIIIPLFKQKKDLMTIKNLSDLNGFASIWCCIENMFLASTAEGYACTLRIPLGEDGAWAKEVLRFPDDYFMPCFIGVGKPSEDAKVNIQKEHSINDVIHKNVW